MIHRIQKSNTFSDTPTQLIAFKVSQVKNAARKLYSVAKNYKLGNTLSSLPWLIF